MLKMLYTLGLNHTVMINTITVPLDYFHYIVATCINVLLNVVVLNVSTNMCMCKMMIEIQNTCTNTSYGYLTLLSNDL